MRTLARLTWIEAKLFAREPLAVIFTFAFPIFMLVVLAGVFGNEVDLNDAENLEAWRGVGPTDYYAPSYAALVVLSIGLIVLPLRLAGYRERGVLRRFHAAGLPLYAVIGSQMLLGMALAVIGAIAITAGARIGYGAELPASWPGVLAAFAFGLACFLAIGIALGAVLTTARTAQGAGIILFFVMMMTGGAGPPRGVLADPMLYLSDVLPFTHVVLILQGPWLGYGWDGVASVGVAAFTVAAALVSVRFFRWQ